MHGMPIGAGDNRHDFAAHELHGFDADSIIGQQSDIFVNQTSHRNIVRREHDARDFAFRHTVDQHKRSGFQSGAVLKMNRYRITFGAEFDSLPPHSPENQDNERGQNGEADFDFSGVTVHSSFTNYRARVLSQGDLDRK